MRIHTRLVYQLDPNTDSYVLIHEDGYDLPAGSPVALCKGASDQQKQLEKSQADFYNTMTADYSKQFAGQNAILQSLNSSLQPIIKAGPSQYGFSQGETNDLNSEAIQGTAQNFNNAKKQLQEQQAAQGGGTQFLPSGVSAQQDAELAAAGANQTSQELLGIKQAGYTQGHNDYESAVGQQEGVAGLYNPTGYSSTATGAGNAAANEADTIQRANAAASPWSMIGGILGGATNAAIGAFTGGSGSSVTPWSSVAGSAPQQTPGIDYGAPAVNLAGFPTGPAPTFS